MGSLKGASADHDDETFFVNCSFPVTLFGQTGSKVFVSSNGLFTLNEPSLLYEYQKLPYYAWFKNNKLPQYVLAPFWADLKIYQNTPQGIYYEETGEKPNRKLEVEWYMSRFNAAKEYYHFSVIVEEAKPNFATFK